MLSLLLPTTISIVPLFMNIQKLNLGGSFVPLWLSYWRERDVRYPVCAVL